MPEATAFQADVCLRALLRMAAPATLEPMAYVSPIAICISNSAVLLERERAFDVPAQGNERSG